MAKKKLEGGGRQDPDEQVGTKFSFLLSTQMMDEINKAAGENEITPSQLMRIAIRHYLNYLLAGGEVRPPERLEVQDPDLSEIVEATARDLGLNGPSLVHQIVMDHIQEYIRRGQERRELLRSLKDQTRRPANQDQSEH